MTAAPTRKNRLYALDVVRCLALIGMLAAHTLPMWDDNGDRVWLSYVVEGHTSALFILLAGVGLGLSSPLAAPATTVRQRVWRRALVVGFFGVLLLPLEATEISPIDSILTNYAWLFVAALPFLRLRCAALLGWVALWLVVMPPVVASLAAAWPMPPQANWWWLLPSEFLREQWLSGHYPVALWLVYLLLGLALQRSGAITRWAEAESSGSLWRVSGPWLLLGATMAASGYGAYRLVQTKLPEVWNQGGAAVWGIEPHSGSGFELLYSGGLALLFVAIMLPLLQRLWHVRRAQPLLAVLAGAGQLSLSLYFTHVLIAGPLEALAEHYFNGSSIHFGWQLCLLLFAGLWAQQRQAHGLPAQGPLERWQAQVVHHTHQPAQTTKRCQ